MRFYFKLLSLFLLITVIISPALPVSAQPLSTLAWQKFGTTPYESNFEALSISPEDPDFFLLGSRTRLYYSFDGGKSWESVFGLSISNQHTIRRLAIHPFDVNHLFLLTSEGLFQSFNQGQSWWPAHLGIGENKPDVLCIAFHPRDRTQILLGTNRGIYITQDSGKNWTEGFPVLGQKRIQDVLFHPLEKGNAYAATSSEIYRLDLKTSQSEKLYEIKHPASLDGIGDDDQSATSEDFDPESMNSLSSGIRRLTISNWNRPTLFIADGRNILESHDRGKRWDQTGTLDAKSAEIEDLFVSSADETLLVSTSDGFYFFDRDSKHFRQIYKGLSTPHIRTAAHVLANEEAVMAVTDEGLFRLVYAPLPWPTEVPVNLPSEKALELFKNWIEKEPTVTQVQQAAVSYANVDNRKISRWHRASRLSKLLPEFSIDSTWTEESNFDLDRGGTSDKDTFIMGPNETGFDWGMGVNWNLGELIWSTAQTSIDVRDKLMVELREDVLREVTRLYFERRRNQITLAAPLAESTQVYADTLVRVQELAAQMDAMTGRCFASQWQFPDWTIPAEAPFQEIKVETTE